MTIYRYLPSQDEDAGVTFDRTTATVIADSASCSVQPSTPAPDYGEGQGRVSQVNEYTVIFPTDLGLNIKDVIAWNDDGTEHILSVVGSANWAGRSSAWGITAREIV